MEKDKIKDYWNRTSSIYQEECKIPIKIHYGNGAPFEEEVNLLGRLNGKKILELGCGGGQCSIAMSKSGAIVTGIDISEKQIAFAKALAVNEKVKVQFYQCDGQDLSQFQEGHYDLVFSVWALLYIGNLKECFREVHRVLMPYGKFVFSLPHPFYRTIDTNTLKLKESYFDNELFECNEKLPDNSSIEFICFRHTFSDILNSLIDANLSLEMILEPDSRIHYEGDPWYGKWDCNPQLMAYIPPTVIFKTVKK